jgi:hypothetical protein
MDQVKVKSEEKSKEDKIWPAQAVKIESVVNRAAVHKGMKSTSRPSSPARPSAWTGSADSNPHALRSADRREEVVADGVPDDDEWAPFECPDEIATAEVDQVKAKSIKRDIPFALRRGTIGQVTSESSDSVPFSGRARARDLEVSGAVDEARPLFLSF